MWMCAGNSILPFHSSARAACNDHLIATIIAPVVMLYSVIYQNYREVPRVVVNYRENMQTGKRSE